MMTETIAFLLALAVALGILLALVVSARRRRAFESGKISLLALALLAMQPACTARQAKIGALEFAACEGQEVVLPTLSSLGQALATRPDWQTWGLSTLGGALGPSVVCALRALATAHKADAAVTPAEDLVILRRLAARCGPKGECAGAEERAAWLLWRASGRAWPASGEG